MSFFLSVIAFFVTQKAFPYAQVATDSGDPVAWDGNWTFPLVGNEANQSGLSSAELFRYVTQGLQRWRIASGGTIRFDYWQGQDSANYLKNSELNGQSSLYFASQAAAPIQEQLGGSVIGLTQVWFESQTGKILEADIVLNDRSFRFTTDEKDSSIRGLTDSNGKVKVFLGNVLTHELGHAFGMTHSSVLNSTMFPHEATDQNRLGCDDQSGIQSLYEGGIHAHGGSITGRVTHGSGEGVSGASVLAISANRGAAYASVYSKSDGSFEIRGLEDDTYFLMIEPVDPVKYKLPDAFRSMNPFICGNNQPFVRTPVMEGVFLRPFQVKNESTQNVGDLVVSCTSENFVSPSSFQWSSSLHSLAWIERYPRSSEANYRMTQWLGGRFRTVALSYSLFSNLQVSMSLVSEQNGSLAATEESLGGGTSEHQLKNNDLLFGNYELRTRIVGTTSASNFPGQQTFIEPDSFVIFVLTKDAARSGGDTCRSDQGLGEYQSPPGGPPGSEEEREYDGKLLGFCGTTSLPSPPVSPGGIISWFFPWFLLLAFRIRLRFN